MGDLPVDTQWCERGLTGLFQLAVNGLDCEIEDANVKAAGERVQRPKNKEAIRRVKRMVFTPATRF